MVDWYIWIHIHMLVCFWPWFTSGWSASHVFSAFVATVCRFQLGWGDCKDLNPWSLKSDPGKTFRSTVIQ